MQSIRLKNGNIRGKLSLSKSIKIYTMVSHDIELISNHPRAAAIRLKQNIQKDILKKYETGKTMHITFNDGLVIRIDANFITLSKLPDVITMDKSTSINFIELLTELRRFYENKINTSASH